MNPEVRRLSSTNPGTSSHCMPYLKENVLLSGEHLDSWPLGHLPELTVAQRGIWGVKRTERERPGRSLRLAQYSAQKNSVIVGTQATGRWSRWGSWPSGAEMSFRVTMHKARILAVLPSLRACYSRNGVMESFGPNTDIHKAGRNLGKRQEYALRTGFAYKTHLQHTFNHNVIHGSAVMKCCPLTISFVKAFDSF